jgi:cytoskeletal protein CcmA (bactofilin family)
LILKNFGEQRMIFKRSRQPTNGSNNVTHSGPSIVAQDVTIEGNVTAAGELHIDGTVYGTVRAHSCVIDMNGFVQGEIIAQEVFVRGRVIGPIRGAHVNLYAGAQVEGDILNETISIENGANIYGMISRVENPASDTASQLDAASSNGAFSTPSLSFGQDNFYDNQEDNAFRPVKVVRPG